ncbi:hypothetical protein Tco_1044733 [Tanacetum coccineum]|uniref:Uncharacterized protein n=1 Tax=Tanacetum coccineum TaxID=301880 RepID=A0ABQ5GTB2_9ASTR
MVVMTLDVKKDPFRPQDVDEEILGPEVPYLRAIGALMFLAGIKDIGLYFTNPSNTSLVDFADARYMSDPHNGTSQTGNHIKEKGKRVAPPSSSSSSLSSDENEEPSFLEFYEELSDNEDLTDAHKEKRGMFKCLNR